MNSCQKYGLMVGCYMFLTKMEYDLSEIEKQFTQSLESGEINWTYCNYLIRFTGQIIYELLEVCHRFHKDDIMFISELVHVLDDEFNFAISCQLEYDF